MPKIEKIQVTKGVYWVAIPEADLYVLCGCPADSVKHLMKSGLILIKEVNGIEIETGPNAILLSDVLVQNGHFSNLTEFPFFQMLYRQGMGLPNHPNNTGIKPLLIGAEDQLNSQLQYIYRGNYGLISEEEIIAAGISKEQAQIMMRLKLKFAFGKIQPTDELLETVVVKDQPIEIRNGVYINRLSFNVYEFLYQGESISVNLNLAPHEEYGAPYQLEYHQVRREYFAIVHSGEGDGWDTHRPCMASILMYHGKIYLIDAGPNIVYSLSALGIGVNEIEGIFHTHAHDDHFAGLPTLMRMDRRIKYYSTPLVRASVTKKLSALVSIKESNFSDYFEVHDLEFDTWNDIEGLEVYPIFSPHPVETSNFIFRTLWKDGYCSYGHYADIVSFQVLKSMITENNSEPGITQEFFNEIQEKYAIPVNLKKIDIGGGLIHGMAEDFKKDRSDKIILSHTALSLTSHEKEIGSEASFGSTDVLIASNQNYIMQYAAGYLRSYLSSVSHSQLRVLLNNNLVTFNAGTILLKKGSINENIYLILGGNVEMIHADEGIQCVLSAGSIISEFSEFSGTPSQRTYRTTSFVQALQLPSSLYFEFAKLNKIYKKLAKLEKIRAFLRHTWLLGDGISDPIQNKLAHSMEIKMFNKDHVFSSEHTNFYLIKTGKLQSYVGNNHFETLTSGDFFGEEKILFDIPCFFLVKVIEPTELYYFPDNVLLDIPIARWKMLETFQKRMKKFGKYVMKKSLL